MRRDEIGTIQKRRAVLRWLGVVTWCAAYPPYIVYALRSWLGSTYSHREVIDILWIVPGVIVAVLLSPLTIQYED